MFLCQFEGNLLEKTKIFRRSREIFGSKRVVSFSCKRAVKSVSGQWDLRWIKHAESTVGICTKSSVQCNIAHRQDLGNKTRVVSKFRTRQLDIQVCLNKSTLIPQDNTLLEFTFLKIVLPTLSNFTRVDFQIQYAYENIMPAQSTSQNSKMHGALFYSTQAPK